MPSKFNLKYLAVFGLVIVLIVTGSLFYVLRSQITQVSDSGNNSQNNNLSTLTGSAQALAFDKFKSCDEVLNGIENFYKDNQNNYGGGTMPMMGSTMSKSVTNSAAPSAQTRTGAMEASDSDFSGTNNQVQNVDEGDILKTDGKNIYTVNGRNINISSINPADGILTKVSKIQLSQLLSNVNQLNLYQNYLVVNGSNYNSYSTQTAVGIYDISDVAKPVLVR